MTRKLLCSLALVLALTSQPVLASELPDTDTGISISDEIPEDTDAGTETDREERTEPEEAPYDGESQTDAARENTEEPPEQPPEKETAEASDRISKEIPETEADIPDEDILDEDIPDEDILEDDILEDDIPEDDAAAEDTSPEMLQFFRFLISLLIVSNLFSALSLGCLCAVIFSRYMRG